MQSHFVSVSGLPYGAYLLRIGARGIKITHACFAHIPKRTFIEIFIVTICTVGSLSGFACATKLMFPIGQFDD